jgi:hypothetical protein
VAAGLNRGAGVSSGRMAAVWSFGDYRSSPTHLLPPGLVPYGEAVQQLVLGFHQLFLWFHLELEKAWRRAGRPKWCVPGDGVLVSKQQSFFGPNRNFVSRLGVLFA